MKQNNNPLIPNSNLLFFKKNRKMKTKYAEKLIINHSVFTEKGCYL